MGSGLVAALVASQIEGRDVSGDLACTDIKGRVGNQLLCVVFVVIC